MLTKLIHGAVFVFLLITFVMAQGGGYALDFDGSDDYSKHGTNSSLRPTSAITLEAWIFVHQNANWEGAVSYATDNGATESGYDLFCKGGSTNKWSIRVARVGMSEGDWAADPYALLTRWQWTHVAGTYDGSTSRFYKNGALERSETNSGNIDWSPSPDKFYLGKFSDSNENNFFDGYLDEVRIWSVARTAAQIADNIHVELDGDETGLEAYFKMSNGSGTTLTDNSSNSNDGELRNMVTSGGSSVWITSDAPIGDLTNGYTTDVEALWEGSGTSASDASDGLTMVVGTALTDANFAVFGNNNTAGTSTSDLPSGVEVRSERIWYVDESNTVAADVTIDISDATGYTVTAGTASDYKLLNRAGTSGDFSILASGSSKSGDAVTFSSVTLSDEYLAIGQATDSDAYLSAHVTISGDDGFRMMSSPVDGQIYGDLLDELWTQGIATGADVTTGSANVWTYDAANTEWDALTNLNTASLTAGQGFLVYVFANADNDGDDDLPVTLSVAGTENSATVTRSTTASEWNLLGNPFEATIDADQLFSDNSNYTAVVYVYDDAKSGGAGYYSWNGSGTLTDGLIAPYQGFWIESGGSGTSFEFTSDCKSASAGTFYKTMNDSTGSMSFAISSGEDYEDNAFVSFMNSGEAGMDNADAYKLLPMSPSERVVAISYAEGNGLDINNLPVEYEGSISIPLDIMYLTLDENYNFVTQAEDVNMTWDLSSLPGHISMTLTDNITGNSVDLTQQSEVTFATVEKGSFPAYGSGGVSIYPQVGESRFTLTAAYSALSAADEATNVPKEFALHPAYPNPFNPSTTITFDVPIESRYVVSLQLYDIKGRLVETLINEVFPAGSHSIQWNPVNLSSGLYIVQLKAGETVFNQKITFIK